MHKFLPQSFNDLLCLILILLIAGLWILMGLQLLELPAEVTGALIVTWTLLCNSISGRSKANPQKNSRHLGPAAAAIIQAKKEPVPLSG